MGTTEIQFFTPETPEWAVRRHIEKLMDEVAYLSHAYKIDIDDAY
jgi:hypothetical protein